MNWLFTGLANTQGSPAPAFTLKHTLLLAVPCGATLTPLLKSGDGAVKLTLVSDQLILALPSATGAYDPTFTLRFPAIELPR